VFVDETYGVLLICPSERTEVVALGSLQGDPTSIFMLLDIFSKLKTIEEFERQLNLRDF
jgi:hypothetical protein